MATPERISIVLDRLQQYLAAALGDGTILLDQGNADGRINSQANERQISHALRLFTHSNDWFAQQTLTLEVAEARHWYDFAVRGDGLFIPVNVKVSTCRAADNLSSKEGLFYALTGVDPTTVHINSWELFCQQLAQNMGTDINADYYFMVVNKLEPGDVFWTTLKSLEDLRSSGANPPYQCRWSANRNRQDRDYQEAASFVLAVVRESFVKGASALLSFDEHLAQYGNM